MVTGCKPPHNVPADASACVRHLLISRAEAQTVNLLYTPSYNSLLCRSRPCNFRFAGHATLVTFHNRGTYTGQSRFSQGQPSTGTQVNWKAEPCAFSIHATVASMSFYPSVDNNDPSYHMAFSLWVISRDDQKVRWNHHDSQMMGEHNG